jgi:hypothetical protein
MADVDPRMMKVSPRIRYNTIGGVNGPLVILESVRGPGSFRWQTWNLYIRWIGQIPKVQRDSVLDSARRLGAVWPGTGSSR